MTEICLLWELLDKIYYNINYYLLYCYPIEYVDWISIYPSKTNLGVIWSIIGSVKWSVLRLKSPPFFASFLHHPLELKHTRFSFSWTQFLLVSKTIQHLTLNLTDLSFLWVSWSGSRFYHCEKEIKMNMQMRDICETFLWLVLS